MSESTYSPSPIKKCWIKNLEFYITRFYVTYNSTKNRVFVIGEENYPRKEIVKKGGRQWHERSVPFSLWQWNACFFFNEIIILANLASSLAFFIHFSTKNSSHSAINQLFPAHLFYFSWIATHRRAKIERTLQQSQR